MGEFSSSEEPGSREVTGFALSTILGTIIYVPVNFTALIFGFRYAANIGVSGTLTGGTVVGQVLTQDQGGTITGTIDVFSLEPGASLRDSSSEHALAVGKSGEYIVGNVITPTSGSIMGVMTYAYVPGRITST